MSVSAGILYECACLCTPDIPPARRCTRSCLQGNHVRQSFQARYNNSLVMRRLSVHGDHMVKFADEAGSKSSFGVQMSTPFRYSAIITLSRSFCSLLAVS